MLHTQTVAKASIRSLERHVSGLRYEGFDFLWQFLVADVDLADVERAESAVAGEEDRLLTACKSGVLADSALPII